MRALLMAAALLVAACKCPCPCGPDAGADMSAPRDLARPADLSSSPDLSCIKCDAVLNPCPALGLSCDPVARCCAAAPVVDLSSPADLSDCQPRLASCVAPLRCCPGLSCVGGLCATVPLR